jgi:hypothetical protein
LCIQYGNHNLFSETQEKNKNSSFFGYLNAQRVSKPKRIEKHFGIFEKLSKINNRMSDVSFT